MLVLAYRERRNFTHVPLAHSMTTNGSLNVCVLESSSDICKFQQMNSDFHESSVGQSRASKLGLSFSKGEYRHPPDKSTG